MVGAVIVCDDKIIGEGFTSAYGGAHAEVNAIQAVTNIALLKKSTLYVSLEPCSHYGKTPPCADLIIKHKIPNVVIGLLDPHEKVKGQGIKKLIDAGCNVTVGILEKECQEHHKRFLTFHNKKRPFILLKWAETADGFITPIKDARNTNLEPYWITNAYSRQLVHKWRAEEQAILVGTNTVLLDNPKLNTRLWKGKNPLRLVIDRDLKIQGDFHVLDKSTPTIFITQVAGTLKYIDGIQYEVLDFSKDLATQILEILYKRNILSILIEGGAQTLKTFIDANLWDEARIFIGTTTFAKGTKAPTISSKILRSSIIEKDSLNIYKND